MIAQDNEGLPESGVDLPFTENAAREKSDTITFKWEGRRV